MIARVEIWLPRNSSWIGKDKLKNGAKNGGKLLQKQMKNWWTNILKVKKVIWPKKKSRKVCVNVPSLTGNRSMLCGTSFKTKAFMRCWTRFIEYLPSPVDIPPVAGINRTTIRDNTRKLLTMKFSAVGISKLWPTHFGKLDFFRVYSGVIKSGDTRITRSKGKKNVLVVFCRCMLTNVKKFKEVRAGDIAAAVGLKDATTGETFAMIHPSFTLEKWFPWASYSTGCRTKTKADQEKWVWHLNRWHKKILLSV